ncbi:hypothetical protein ELQ90_02695 [Labedella phragmitis]|uniref:Uncharacterized protein n=1 Tax=Labedella phragmitis TaxID=2498849 RepID=A0A3S4BLP8_9MICO|nr:hypothetical protein [Labedella phragmitis]RWZ52865.1 hypothetical protein ELQ90_02695 [Labedella phragmitis]
MKIVGGAALAKLYPDDDEVRPTADVDALFEPVSDVLIVADAMAQDYALRPDWLNSAARPFMARGLAESADDSFHVYAAEPEELIAMKMARGAPQDIDDLRILARHLGITSPARLVQIAYTVYGADSVHLQDGEDSYLLFAEDVLGT